MIRDLLERLFWTFVSAFLGALTGSAVLDLGLDAVQVAALAGLGAVANAVLLIARWRLSVLPNPGEGLPGLPTEGTLPIRGTGSATGSLGALMRRPRSSG